MKAQRNNQQHAMTEIEAASVSLDEMINTTRTLTDKIKRITVYSGAALREEGILEEIEVVERWVESYRRGLSAAHKISETGMSIMKAIQARVALAIEEQLRLEDEGSMSLSTAQQQNLEGLRYAHARLQRIIQDMEMIFLHACSTHEQHDSVDKK